MIKFSLKKITDMYSSIIYWVSKLFSTGLKKDLFHKSNDYTHRGVFTAPFSSINSFVYPVAPTHYLNYYNFM